MRSSGVILVDGHRVGTISVDDIDDDESVPPAGAMSLDNAWEGPTFRPGIGPGSRIRARRHGPEMPGHRPTVTREEKEPTFRPHVQPRGKAPPAKPQEFTLKDVHEALAGKKPGTIDRSWQRSELEANPGLKERLFRHALGENDDPLANQAVMEEAANRGDIRRRIHGGGGMGDHGNLTYFQGYHQGPISAAQREMLERNYRKVFVEGSDIAHGAIDNSSLGLAQREIGSGRFKNVANYGGDRIPGHPGVESFHIPGTDQSGTGERDYYPRWREEQERSGGPPSGVTRLPADPSYRPPPSSESTSDVGPEGSVKPVFPVASNVNVSHMQPEMVARLNAAYRAAPDDKKFTVISGYRPATREEARALGMSERSSQEDIWERSEGGRLFAAAPPGRSRHQFGEAADVSGPGADWLIQHLGQFGLEHAKPSDPSFDPYHVQLQRSFQGSFARGERTPTAALTPAGTRRVSPDIDTSSYDTPAERSKRVHPTKTEDQINAVPGDDSMWAAIRAAGGLNVIRRPSNPPSSITNLPAPPPQKPREQTAPGVWKSEPESAVTRAGNALLDALGIRTPPEDQNK